MAAEEKRNELLETLSWVKQQSPSLHASNTFRSLERQLTSLLGKYQVAEAGHGDAGVLAEVYNDRGHARYMQVRVRHQTLFACSRSCPPWPG